MDWFHRFERDQAMLNAVCSCETVALDLLWRIEISIVSGCRVEASVARRLSLPLKIGCRRASARNAADPGTGLGTVRCCTGVGWGCSSKACYSLQ